MNPRAYERQSKPRNIEVKGLYGRWDVQLHATVDGGREYWWVENANGIDGEEGYWTTRNEVGEYEYFCDAGWGDEANALCHLEDALDDLNQKRPASISGRTPVNIRSKRNRSRKNVQLQADRHP